ncbi:MAG: adenylate/guanylate cyclase domain-containing protein [Candidatus Tritonobacter lacicola]|nr:adenylate/guanylate cyclase domain-containing protein [Candidatus Tritonobacter lacicola]
MIRFFLKRGDRQGEFIDLDCLPAVIGRAESCDMRLADPSVSRRHARITGEEGRYFIHDMGSKNGTVVNGRTVEKAALKSGDFIAIGKYGLMFATEEDAGFVSDAVNSRIQKVLSPDSGKLLEQEDAPGAAAGTGKARDYLRTLYEISRTIAAVSNLDEVLDNIADLVFQVIDPDECQILLKDEQADKLRSVAVRSKKLGEGVPSLVVSRTILNKVLSEQVGILTSDARTDPRFKQAESVVFLNIRSAMCAPLKYKDGILGILHVANHVSSGEFQEDDLRLLLGIANQAAVAIENARLYEKVQSEERIRGGLQRFLSPDLVDQVIRGEKDINLGGEIKEITVMFADIRGFTSLTERVSPTELIEMLNDYFTEMSDIVFEQKGSIDKFIGDAFIAVFGTPFPLSDHAARSIRTALLMQEAMKELNASWRGQDRATFEIGIGISTGPVIYGNVGSEQRMELTVIGDAVNLACRLSQISGPGQILISGETRSEAGPEFRYAPVPNKGIKGKSKNVTIFEAT